MLRMGMEALYGPCALSRLPSQLYDDHGFGIYYISPTMARKMAMRDPGISRPMKRSTRYLLYVLGSGVLITWLQQPSGLFTIALVLALIIASAYLDAWLFHGPDAEGDGSTRFSASNRGQMGRSGQGKEPRLRPAWQAVYDTPFQDEVEVLLRDLRNEKLNPLMVTQRQDGSAGFVYVVRLLEHEVPRGHRVIARFRRQALKQPS